MIDPKSIERLKAQTDIVDIVGHYLPLKKSGANFVCVCPFHDDKNPSMSVSPSRGIFHCFSCKAGGDAIKFVMDYEKLSYPEAVEKIAGLQNFTLNYVRGGEPAKENKHILENANAFYRSLLYKTPAAASYLYSRGITDELIDKFELGFAPESAQTIRLLQNEQIEPKEALEVGIVKQNENGIYASFINRITFPIYTHAGRLVGFGGRTISGNPAKYVNSPQSAVFDKSTLFYGYHLAKREIFAKRLEWLVDGQNLGSVSTTELIRYGRVEINRDTCTLCLSCVGACNVAALVADKKTNSIVFNPSVCTACGYCELSCAEKDTIFLRPGKIDLEPSFFTFSELARDELFACIECGKEFARREGVLVGISSGAVLAAATELAKRPDFAGKTIVVLLPDSGDRYLSTDLFQDK